MSATRGLLFDLHVLQVSRRLYMEDETGDMELHIIYGNIFTSFIVSVSFS